MGFIWWRRDGQTVFTLINLNFIPKYRYIDHYSLALITDYKIIYYSFRPKMFNWKLSVSHLTVDKNNESIRSTCIMILELLAHTTIILPSLWVIKHNNNIYYFNYCIINWFEFLICHLHKLFIILFWWRKQYLNFKQIINNK